MGSDIYDRGERIKELKQQSDKIRDDTLKMYHDPKKSTSEILESWEKKDKIEDKIKRLEEIDKIEKNFEKNINLDEYRNPDGTFNIYKCERALDFKGGEASNNVFKKLHHEGVAIGNDKKMFFTDYGTKKEYLDVRFWDSAENKDKWKKIKKVGTSNATSEDVKGILFGEKSENWNDHDDYKTFYIIENIMQKKK